jgi:hypothetical protein
MRVIIAGSRTIKDGDLVAKAIKESKFKVSSVLCGGARGADILGKSWAEANKIQVDEHPANWTKYSNAAGIMRNIVMANNADALIAIWDGKSPGTRHMIDEAKKRNLKVYVKMLHESAN